MCGINETLTSLNYLAAECHCTAKEKGWHEKERSPLEIAALIHSEISEFVEDERDPQKWPASGIGLAHDGIDCILPAKPIGPAIELADALIRILDYMQHRGYDIECAVRLKMEYNKTRAHRHGGKKY